MKVLLARPLLLRRACAHVRQQAREARRRYISCRGAEIGAEIHILAKEARVHAHGEDAMANGSVVDENAALCGAGEARLDDETTTLTAAGGPGLIDPQVQFLYVVRAYHWCQHRLPGVGARPYRSPQVVRCKRMSLSLWTCLAYLRSINWSGTSSCSYPVTKPKQLSNSVALSPDTLTPYHPTHCFNATHQLQRRRTLYGGSSDSETQHGHPQSLRETADIESKPIK